MYLRYSLLDTSHKRIRTNTSSNKVTLIQKDMEISRSTLSIWHRSDIMNNLTTILCHKIQKLVQGNTYTLKKIEIYLIFHSPSPSLGSLEIQLLAVKVAIMHKSK